MNQHEKKEERRREKREAKVAQKQQRSEINPAAESTFIAKIRNLITSGADGGQSK